jgi:antitoxin component YwqK of YwqJK toxin-antitoxin module
MRTDREKHGLRGPARSVHVETARFEEQDGQIAEKPWFSHTTTFNQDGWLSEQINRNPDGSEWRIVNDYSDSCKLLATRIYNPSGALSSEMGYSYDNEGRLVAQQHITQDGKVTTPTTYAYDSGGGKIKIQEFDFSGEANVMIGIEGTSTSISADEVKRIETRYDDRGEAVDVKAFNTAGSLVSRVEITRDERGNPLEETQYAGDVVPFGPCASGSCSTEEMAALTEEQKAELAAELARLFSPGTAMSKHTHRYDVEGRLIESKLTIMGMEAGRQTFAYDEAGNKSEEVSYKEDGTLGSKAVFAREYDEHGNWIKELVSAALNWDAEFGLSTPNHVTRRIITYW